jgi:hypothetical protein
MSPSGTSAASSAPGQARLFHPILNPDLKRLSDGRQVPRKSLDVWGTISCFAEYNL